MGKISQPVSSVDFRQHDIAHSPVTDQEYDDDEEDHLSESAYSSPQEVSPIARKFQFALQGHVFQDIEQQTGCRPDVSDHWRIVEDVLMKALLKHWGDGSFEPAQRGDISPKKDLENSLKDALAGELKTVKRNAKLTRAESNSLFSGWAESLCEGVHEGKPCVSLGEATMCFQRLAEVY